VRGHIHTDIVAAAFTVATVIVGLHALRAGGAMLGQTSGPLAGLGKTMAGLATFN
jgi:hypothetical protein